MPSELAYDGGGFHALGEAVDFSNGGDAGTPEMDAGAAFWLGYAPYLLELIHVNQDGSMVGVKNGEVVDALSFYGQGTMAQHRNHYHVAATNAGIQAAGGAGPGVAADPTSAAASGGGGSSISKLSDALSSSSFWERVGIGTAGVFMALIGADVLHRGI